MSFISTHTSHISIDGSRAAREIVRRFPTKATYNPVDINSDYISPEPHELRVATKHVKAIKLLAKRYNGSIICYAILPIKPKGIRLLGRRSELPETWTEDYTRTLAALAHLNLNKPLDRERAASLEKYLDVLDTQLRHAGRGKIGYRPQPDSLFNRYPNTAVVSLKHLKTAIRANSPTNTREKAWSGVGERVIPFRPAAGESIKMKQMGGMDALDQRHFMEAAAIALPIGAGREPGLLGEKVPGEITMGPFGTRTIKGNQFLGGDYTGFSPMKFHQPVNRSKRKWQREMNRFTIERYSTPKKLTQDQKDLLTRLKASGAGIGGLGLTALGIRELANATVDSFTSGADHIENKLQDHLGETWKNPKTVSKMPELDIISKAKQKIASVATKHGHEMSTAWRYPAYRKTAEQLLKRRKRVGLGLLATGLPTLIMSGAFIEHLNHKNGNKKHYLLPVPKLTTDQRKHLIDRGLKVAGAVGIFGAAGMPVVEAPGYNSGFKKGETGDLLGRRQRTFRRFIPGYVTGFTDGRDTFKQRKEMTKHNSLSASDTYYYEAGFSENFKNHWKRIKDAFRHDFKPTVIRGAFVGGLGKLHQEVGLPPTTVDGIPVNRRSFNNNYAPFTTNQLHKVHDDLEARMRVGDFDTSNGEEIRKVIQNLEQEIIARRVLPSI